MLEWTTTTGLHEKPFLDLPFKQCLDTVVQFWNIGTTLLSAIRSMLNKGNVKQGQC
jgi:uncharacterized protein YceK